MPQYTYKARDEFGRGVRGTQAADEVDQLASLLKEKNLYLIQASKKKSPSALFGPQKIKRQDLIDFSYHLATILKAGIPILSGLQDLARQRKGTSFGKILETIIEDLEGGALLHNALDKHSQAFGETYVSMTEAGETSGNLEKILNELAKFLEWQEELSSNIKKFSIYPIAVMVAISGIIMYIFTFVLPRIFPILQSMNVSLPLSTRALIKLSSFFKSYWHIMLIALFGGIIGLRLASHAESGRMILDRLKLRLPVIGNFIRKIAISRFTHHLSLLLDAGVPIIQSLTLVEKVVGNQVIAEVIKRAKDSVQGGSTLSEALQGTGEFDITVIRMIFVGESTGTLSDALVRISDYYDREVPATVKKIFSALEPAIIVFLALIVGVVVLSIYIPIYQGIGMIGR